MQDSYRIFNQDCELVSQLPNKNRVESLLSAIFNEEVQIVDIVPREGNRMVEDGSLIIMDIIVQLSSGSFINVEMQKYGFLFPGERSDCYVADFIMRQYNKLKSEKAEKFSYQDMKPFYIVVLMSNSSKNFLAVSPAYIHNENITYDSGAKVTSLSHIKYISLDTFHKTVDNVSNKLDAWLTFLSSDEAKDIVTLINAFPEFMQLYQEIAEFRTKPRELISMYSEALAIADRNTVKLMIDEMKEELDSLNVEAKEYREQISSLTVEVNESKEQVSNLTAEVNERKEQVSNLTAEVNERKEQVSNLTVELSEKENLLKEQAKEIERLKALLTKQ